MNDEQELTERAAATPDVRLTDERRDLESMFTLDPATMDPEMSYKFVREDKMRIARHKMRGYRVVLTDTDKVRPYVDFDDHGDGAIRVGDCILMQCPRDKAEARKRSNERLATERLAAPKKKFEQAAKKRGVRTIQDPD